MHKTFDVVVIGSGSAGFSAAEAARRAGAGVCLIEKEKLGGECPNWGCVPSKALLKSTKTIKTLRNARMLGITPGSFSVDFEDIMTYQRKVVETITGGGELGERYLALAKQLKITIELGEASFFSKDAIVVKKDGKEKEVRGKAFVIATGSIPFIPPIEGIDKTHYLGFKDVLALKSKPKSIAIIGAGPIGCEYATFFSGIGTHVSLIDSADTILNREEPEISELALEAMQKQGIDAHLGAIIVRMWDAGSAVYGVEIEKKGVRQIIAVERILLAAGKRAAIDGLDLESLGVAFDDNRNIKTSKEQQTSVKNIYAAGDVVGGYQFTHIAHQEGYIAGYNAALTALKKRSNRLQSDQRVVPRVTFVDPEVASVGLTSPEARKKYGNVLVGSYPLAALGRAVTENETFGLLKIIADAKTRKVVGGHIIGPSAGEIIHEIALAMYLNAKIDKLAEMIHAYPTFSEAVRGAAGNVERM